MRLFIPSCAFSELLLKSSALVLGIVKLAEAVGDFHLSDKYFPALGPFGLIRLLFRERRDRSRKLVNNRWLHEMLFGYSFKQVCDCFASWLVRVVCHVRMRGVKSGHERFDCILRRKIRKLRLRARRIRPEMND